MSTSDKHHPALLRSPSSLQENSLLQGEKSEALSRIPSERLSVELDFVRISHETPSTSTHPHVLFSPVHYEPGYAYPLIVWLHGTGGDERQVMRIMPTVSMRNYVAVAPQGVTTIQQREKSEQGSPLDLTSILRGGIRPKLTYDWPETDDGLLDAERRIFECISIAKDRCNIAANRVFVVGYGTGGTMALKMGLLYPEHFAGVASLGGGFPKGSSLFSQWAVARKKLSVFLGVGQSSTVFSPQSAFETLELFHTAGLGVAMREYPCGQELAPQMLQDVNRWIMERVCG